MLGAHEQGQIILGTREHLERRNKVSTPAFVSTRNKNYSPSFSSQLRYSSDEDGTSIHNNNWLQTTNKQDAFCSGKTYTDSVMRNDKDTVDFPTANNDVRERRNRRLRSLINFNQASVRHQKKVSASSLQNTIGAERRSTAQEAGSKRRIENDLPELPHNDLSQLQAIRSNAPAILLPSGPGTGKTYVLSLRIAYLLRKHVMKQRLRLWNSKCADNDINQDTNDDEFTTPDSIVILSFTNRDAERLKERALDCLYPPHRSDDVNVATSEQIWRNETSRQLWAGTMHAFSLAILNKYGPSSSPLKVLPAREMRNRVSAALRSLLVAHDGGKHTSINSEIRMLQSRHLQALNDVGHSRSILYQNIVRCIDIWKEAGIPLTSPEPSSVAAPYAEDNSLDEEIEDHDLQQREFHVTKSCLELASRLGINESSALLALDIFPAFQARHAEAGTADPSDLAGMTYRLLVAQPESLRLLRSKLKHIIVDEYQDMSVSQHSLLRLVVRGIVNDDETLLDTSDVHKKSKFELRQRRRLPVLLEPNEQKRRFKASFRNSNTLQSYSVPSIFCAGDASQSIYGWRGGSPELTIHGFRRDYPQGVVAQLAVCYRLPNDVAEAAEMLFPMGLTETVSKVSPAAAAKAASSLHKSLNPIIHGDSDQRSTKEQFRLGNQLLLSKGMQKIDSTVILHGLWDAREEAKYIASIIRRRSKERKSALISALNNLDGAVMYPPANELMDLTDVAIMVRSSNQLHLLKEALGNAGIPFTTDESHERGARTKEGEETKNYWLTQKREKMAKSLPMKPVFLLTMHRSKGEEFDDVYLAGWTEGEFPHPDAVSANRVHEERRLAYVALTRARQRVVITHSFVKRVLNHGSDGRKKYVTGQVNPSRFLYELKPSKRIEDGATRSSDISDPPWLPSSDNKGTVWDRSRGIKEFVAGQNLPYSFQKAYQQPQGFVAEWPESRPNVLRVSSNASAENPITTPIEVIEAGLKDIVSLRKKGAAKKYVSIFKEMLHSFFQISRGYALVFASGAGSKQTVNESVYRLIEAPADELVRKPLCKCTAMQLGHYLAYLILKPEMSPPSAELKPLSRGARRHCQKIDSNTPADPLDTIEIGLHEIIVLRSNGASKKYTRIFKEMLASLLEIRKGNALVFKSGAKQAKNESVRALVNVAAENLEKKPLSRCTATQLGHYLAYLLIGLESND